MAEVAKPKPGAPRSLDAPVEPVPPVESPAPIIEIIEAVVVDVVDAAGAADVVAVEPARDETPVPIRSALSHLGIGGVDNMLWQITLRRKVGDGPKPMWMWEEGLNALRNHTAQ
jgi:hypothetical protein